MGRMGVLLFFFFDYALGGGDVGFVVLRPAQ